MSSQHFVGPLRMFPPKFNNYGIHGDQSNFACLSSSRCPLLVVGYQRLEINHCLCLRRNNDQYDLFVIDSLVFSSSDTHVRIEHFLVDRLTDDRYYVLDSLSNVHAIDIRWAKDIEKNSAKTDMASTTVESLFQGYQLNMQIQQLASVQTNTLGQLLVIIGQRNGDRQKVSEKLVCSSVRLSSLFQHLIFIPPRLSTSQIELPTSPTSTSLICAPRNQPSVFVQKIRSLLKQESSSVQQRHLRQHVRLVLLQCVEQQKQVRQQLDNRRRHLDDLEQTQALAMSELQERSDRLLTAISSAIARHDQVRRTWNMSTIGCRHFP